MKRLVLLSFILLAGCQSTAVKTKLTVVTPPDQMYDCPLKKQFPNWEKLNDTDVAKTVIELYKNNVRCKNSVDAIKRYLKDAKVRIDN